MIQPYNRHVFPCGATFQDKRSIENTERADLFSWIAQTMYKVASVLLAPFYCVGLLLKCLLNLVLNAIGTIFSVVFFFRLPSSRKEERVTSRANTTWTPTPIGDQVVSYERRIGCERHSKLISCPNCEHLHYSARYCECRDCAKSAPRLLECYKYHNREAQVLMCPCVDCKYKRPMSEMCEHCVLVSEKVHVQAKMPQDIEIRTRPKRKK